MPQDIPLEASDTLVFTPDSLKDCENLPTFTLRAATTREKRFHRRLAAEEGVRTHPPEAIREEVLRGLKSLWSQEDYERHQPIVQSYWDAGDEFALQAKDDPDLEWSYDSEIEAAVKDLTRKVQDAWPPLRRLLADNMDYATMTGPLMVAVIVEKWVGLDLPRQTDRGFLTLGCAEALREALADYEERAGKPGKEVGSAWTELFVACTQRMYLDKEEEKNSESPSPSEMPQTSSKATKARGKSKASARSKKTPATA